jgi:hypothetical protein
MLAGVVDRGTVRTAASHLAHRLAQGPDTALANAVWLLRDTFDRTLESQLDHESRAIVRAAGSAAGIEGVTALAARRTPDFARHRRRPLDREGDRVRP